MTNKANFGKQNSTHASTHTSSTAKDVEAFINACRFFGSNQKKANEKIKDTGHTKQNEDSKKENRNMDSNPTVEQRPNAP